MARYEHPDVMDNGLAYIRNNCNSMVVISSYTFGDSYATVVAAVLASVAMSPSDMVLSTSGNNRRLTVAGKTDLSADASGGGANSHVALLDTVAGKVLYVTEEDAAQAIVATNAVAIAGFIITRTQPVAP
jgi:hypothetical protein